MNRRIALLILCTTLISLQAFAAGGTLSVHHPWVQAGPPVAKVLAGYLELRNDGDQAVIITGAHSPAFRLVEIHRSVMRDGMMHMIRESRLAVPAHAKLNFAPGGYHLMMIDPRKTLKPGDRVALTLKLANGTTLDATLPVRKAHDMTGMSHSRPIHH